ncbi:hypothetical protein HW49_07780 [Porphyromonadaceae bacterium COT-184 OH4590]|nr:hypothetical protein HW49_07780 [Porphyromonadaceae bacterium COT-184 OH4590]
MNLKSIIIFLTIIISCSCVTGRSFTKSDTEEILFGAGGGFTGSVTTYILKRDGSLYRGNNFLKKISKKEVNNIFSESKSIAEYKYNNPSNMYFFLIIKSKSNKDSKIVWGMENKEVDSKVIFLYEDLKKLLK